MGIWGLIIGLIAYAVAAGWIIVISTWIYRQFFGRGK